MAYLAMRLLPSNVWAVKKFNPLSSAASSGYMITSTNTYSEAITSEFGFGGSNMIIGGCFTSGSDKIASIIKIDDTTGNILWSYGIR